MDDKRRTEAPEREAKRSQSSGEDSAFDRLLHEAAKVSSPGRMLAPGTRLCEGRFVVRRRLGEGGMGVVFEALDTRADMPVAMKTLSRVDAGGIYRLKHEFRSLVGVTHPYLVPLHELFADNDLWFFTMELVHGERFDRYLRQHQEQSLKAVVAQLAAGVQAIHDANKLHRDLKPSNVLISQASDGARVAILDFGLTSAASTPGATQTIERGVAGTPAYMAPEQARAQPATEASDWYAVGVMLFEALTGRLPFEGESLDLLLAKQTSAAPKVHSLAPDAPADLADLCDQLLEKDPAARPAPADIHRITGSELLSLIPVSQTSWRRSGASTSGGDFIADGDVPSTDLAETFVGRAREIGVLEIALGDTNDGKPVLMLVAGPSGIGKTTFVEHFLASVKGRGDAVVLSGRCYQRESVPFKGFDGVIDALSRYLVRLPEADAARLVPRQAAALSRVFPVLGRVEAISSAPQRRGLPSDQIELRYRAFEALKELLAKLAEERPLILSIDDLQWSDRDSARLLKHLLTPPDPPMLLLIATHRDDELDAEGLSTVRDALSEDASGREVDMRTLALGPLSTAESRRLAQQLLSPEERERVERIAREGGGSPFLIGELTRAAHHDENPGDLRSAILGRVASLPQSQRALLHALCVAPRPVMPDLLARVVNVADVSTELRALLSSRLSREVAGKSVASGRKRYLAPYHDRIRETVLDAMPREQRIAWHLRYTTALECVEPLDLDALVDHALGAGDKKKGGDYALRAARQAVEVFAFDRAVALYETALGNLPLSNVERAALLVELAQARTGGGRCGDAARTYLQAAELDPARGQEMQRLAGEQFFINGDVAAGSDAMRHALTDAGFDYDALIDRNAVAPGYLALMERGFAFEPKSEADIDAAELARLDTLWAAALGATWLFSAEMLTITYVRLALELGEPLRVAKGRALLLSAMEAAVDPRGAGRRANELLALLEQLDTPMTRAWAALCRGTVRLWSGDGDLGLADLERAEELMGLPENRVMLRERNVCRIGLAVALADYKGPKFAVDHVLRWMRLADEAGDRFGRMQLRCYFSPVLYPQFGVERVREEIRLGLELTAGLDQPRMRGTACSNLAIVEALEGNLDAALDCCEATYGLLRGREWDTVRHRWARVMINLHAAKRGMGDRAMLLRRAQRDVEIISQPKTLLGEPIQYPILAGLAELAQGQLLLAHDQPEQALALFESALGAARAVPFSIFLAPVCAQLGLLVGGDRGAALLTECEQRFASGGHDPQRLTRFVAISR